MNSTTNYSSGQHNAGADCSGCHSFTLDGTMYTSNGGSTPAAGAYIVAIDNSGTKTNIVVDQNGNFYTNNSFTFPVTIYATSCPTVTPMVATISSGACNASSCHGGTTPAIYLQ